MSRFLAKIRSEACAVLARDEGSVAGLAYGDDTPARWCELAADLLAALVRRKVADGACDFWDSVSWAVRSPKGPSSYLEWSYPAAGPGSATWVVRTSTGEIAIEVRLKAQHVLEAAWAFSKAVAWGPLAAGPDGRPRPLLRIERIHELAGDRCTRHQDGLALELEPDGSVLVTAHAGLRETGQAISIPRRLVSKLAHQFENAAVRSRTYLVSIMDGEKLSATLDTEHATIRT